MKLVKVSNKFFNECKKHNIHKELLFNEDGRPSVLIMKLKYKGDYHKFVVPLRSNISPRAPKEQYMSLPPNKNTKPKHSHGIHYIKLFPIKNEYVQSYMINDAFDLMIKQIIDNNEKDIVEACQDYLTECENGNKHYMSPDIDGILNMFAELENKDYTEEKENDQNDSEE